MTHPSSRYSGASALPLALAAGHRRTQPRFWPEPLTDPGLSIIVRSVPNYHNDLDAVLRALADPTRRAVVERLAKSPAVVSELAAPFSMALPSLMQHLRVLESAGLVTSEKHGRVRTVSLKLGALDVLHLWLGERRTPAEHQADRLGIHLTRATPKEA
jgi:DNA-binding transcriptional ArsR family regulator